jgi:hypothetical protein
MPLKNQVMGPDQIPNIVLKTCAKTLAPGMTKIFQKSIDCGELPDDSLSANVAPVMFISSVQYLFLPERIL